MSGQCAGVAELEALAPGRQVVDATSDIWTKRQDGRWVCFDANLRSSALVTVWAPLTVLPEEGI